MRHGSALTVRRPPPPARRTAPAAPPTPVDTGPVLPVRAWPELSLSFLAFMLYLFVIHSYKIPIATETVVVALLGLALSRGQFRFPPAFWWCAGFLAWSGVTLVFSEDFQIGWTAWNDYVKILLILIVAANAARTPRQVSGFLIFWLACFALFPVRGTLFNFVFGIQTMGRYAWNFLFGNPNDLAAIVLLMLGVTLVAARSRTTKALRTLAIGGTAILTIMVFLTQSRGGFLGLTVFALLTVTTHRKRSQALLVLAVLAALVFAIAPSGVWNRIGGLRNVTSTQSLAEADAEGSAESRFTIWRVAMKVTADHPITGVGFGTYPESHRRYAAADPEFRTKPAVIGRRDTHSTYFRTLAETGVIGAGLFLGFLITVGMFLMRTSRRLAPVAPLPAEQFKYLFASWVAFWTASIFATNHTIVISYLFVGFAGALAAQYEVLSPPRPVRAERSGREVLPMPHRTPKG